MIIVLLWFICNSVVLGDWLTDYNNDPRPVCPTDLNKKPINDRIVGGKDAGLGNFPYVVALCMGTSYSDGIRADQSFCGGTLITDRCVMTAAHCLYTNQFSKDSMWLDVSDYNTRSSNEKTNYLRKVDQIHLHPRYDDSTFNYDIAIITFREPIVFDEEVRTVNLPLPGQEPAVGTMCTVVGWGRTSYKGSRPAVLQKVDVPITSREDCQEHLSHTITENMICAGGKEGEDACLGDSGGCLLSQIGNVFCAVGVVSFGKNCALKGVSGVYTNVEKFVPWIYNKTIDSACKPGVLQPENYNV